MSLTTFKLNSTDFVHVPGLAKAYKHAKLVDDKWMINVFESAFPTLPKEGFDKIAAGDYRETKKGIEVDIEIPDEIVPDKEAA